MSQIIVDHDKQLDAPDWRVDVDESDTEEDESADEHLWDD